MSINSQKRKLDSEIMNEKKSSDFIDSNGFNQFSEKFRLNSRYEKLANEKELELKIAPEPVRFLRNVHKSINEIKLNSKNNELELRTIPNFLNFSISHIGVVKNVETNNIVNICKKGYFALYSNGVRKHFNLSRLLIEVYPEMYEDDSEWRAIPNAPNYLFSSKGEVKRKDTNNKLKIEGNSYRFHLGGGENFRKTRSALFVEVFPELENDGEWYEIPNFNDYCISKDGTIKIKANNKILNGSKFALKNNDGNICRFHKNVILGIVFPFKYDDGKKWKIIPGYNNYRVSDQGDLFNESNQRFLKGYKNLGYRCVNIVKNQPKDTFFLHQLIIRSFVGPPPTAKHTVNHINGVKDDNRLINLEYSTPTEQLNHLIKMGLRKQAVTNRPVIQFDLNDCKIAEFPSISVAASSLNYKKNGIRRVCSGISTKYEGFKWKYKCAIVIEALELPDEDWKVCPINIDYKISSQGRVQKNSKIICHGIDDSGYKRVVLNFGHGIRRQYWVHRLVALCFIPNTDFNTNCVVDHINSDRSNNNVENLRWSSQLDNNLSHSKKLEQIDATTGEVIKIWPCIKHALEHVNGEYKQMHKFMKSQTVYKGYLWKLSCFDSLEIV